MSFFKSILTAASLTAIAACSGLGGGELVRDGIPTGQINLVNGSGATITVVTISECSAASHGFTRLPSGTTIRPGGSYVFTASAGCYDLQAGYGTSSGYTVWDSRFNLSAGQTYTLRAN